ncbi:hypothetical protein ES332_D07G196900v1 [Gossypium tomentosum]|uniref:Uncharacterized protein n=1 Tax=Gossypium tomentosum TaxID=34277 RepID=A0A5D2K8J7_GOSTO|nr:hypothetical protein ES332_D07G196900v1 [Gossypium tomentosum]TYH63501.1 hypothetical protein ES332_D07G196900v1 [Gossypium tomentosum]TYH63502.1 hypothetical protein ES332_D07G196900v1 [Gossypium tomentosum]
MGLSSLPAPSEGVLCVLLVNTALSISMVKGIIRSILHVVGIHLSSSSSSSSSPPSSDLIEIPAVSFDISIGNADSYIKEFRSRMPSTRYDAVCSGSQPEHDCSVCLTRNALLPEDDPAYFW